MNFRRLALSASTLACFTLASTAAQAQNFIGAGVAVVPVYEGSSTYRTVPLPLINYQSGNFFITPRAGLPALGLKTSLAQDLEAGVFLGLDLGRKASRTARTKGLDNIHFHASYGAYLEWTPGPLSLGAAFRKAAHTGYGSVVELRASYAAWESGPHRMRIGVDTQWSSRSAMKTWFGVTQEEAMSSQAGLPAYSPSAGFKSASLFSVWSYRLSSNWSALTTVGVNRLFGDAKDSPLTAQKTNLFGSIGAIYSF